MDFTDFKWQVIHGSLARRLLLRAFLFVLAMAIFPFMQILDDARAAEPLFLNYDDCSVDTTGLSSPAMLCKGNGNLTMSVFKELMSKNMLDSTGKALCVGEGSASAISALLALGFSHAMGVDRHPFFSLLRRRFVYELNFKDNSFDFVFSGALDRVSVPALFVLEAERVLRPGGIGAMLVAARDFYSGSLIRSATPVSSFLKTSNVVQVCGISSFTLVIFRKKFNSVAYFEPYHLPHECPSLRNNKPNLRYLEPLVEETSGMVKPKISYLPTFINVSSRNRLVYINIGAGEYLNSSITNWVRPLYTSVAPQAFNVYVVDHDASVLSSYVKNPGITFVYHPGLAGNKAAASFDSDGDWGMYSDGDDFNFIAWFRETVADGDFVVLAMNARVAELKLLFELFESGAICYVDELFLHCSDSVDCKNPACGDCISLFRSLRNSGIFVHQWSEG